MRLTTKATLLRMQQGYGNKEQTVVDTYKVWVDVQNVGVTTQTSAMMVDMRVDKQVIIYAVDWHNYSHIDIDGTRYRITAMGSTGDRRYSKLLIAREG